MLRDDSAWLEKNLEKFVDVKRGNVYLKVSGIYTAKIKQTLNIQITSAQFYELTTTNWRNRAEIADWFIKKIPAKTWLLPKE